MYKNTYLIITLSCLFSICAFAEEEMSLEAQLEEANRVIEEEKLKQQELSEKLKNIETEIEQLRMRAKELDEEIGDDSN
jgi:septal ring factor EnvC (AmiA/AmiB activator)